LILWRLRQNCEPPRPESAKISSTELYFALRICFQVGLSFWYNFHTHLSIRAAFIFLELRMPRPPHSLGMHTDGQFRRCSLRFGPAPSQKKRARCESNLACTPS
jgi:hypothetical protein